MKEPFLFQMAGEVARLMTEAYPEIASSLTHSARILKSEEERYWRRVLPAVELFERYLLQRFGGQKSSDRRPTSGGRGELVDPLLPMRLEGKDFFFAHDTLGLSVEFVNDLAQEHRWEVSPTADAEYEAELSKQQERGRASWKAAVKSLVMPEYTELDEKQGTRFLGYETLVADNRKVIGIVDLGLTLRRTSGKLEPEIGIVLDQTPFYAEAGGQVGDTGHLIVDGEVVALVEDTETPLTGLIVHKARWVGQHHLHPGDTVTAQVDAERRDSIRRNHTATHLLHAALRHTLGTHVKQAGSLVAPDRLRFDFTHYAPLDPQDLLDIEDLVNEHVLKNEEVVSDVMDLDAAVNSGAMALFGEKYGDKVRVVSIADGSFSRELCGGTHVRRTGDIGLFKVASEGSISAGTRRIEALTGTGVLEDLRRAHHTVAQLARTLRAKPEELIEAAEKLAESEKKLRKQLEAQQMKRAAASAGDLVERAKDVKGVRVLSARVESMDRAAMRQIVDNLRARLASGVIVLGSASDDKVSLIAAVTEDLTNRLDAGKIVKAAAAIVEGSGGGRKDLAEAGGKNAEKLDESLQAVPGIVEQML